MCFSLFQIFDIIMHAIKYLLWNDKEVLGEEKGSFTSGTAGDYIFFLKKKKKTT